MQQHLLKQFQESGQKAHVPVGLRDQVEGTIDPSAVKYKNLDLAGYKPEKMVGPQTQEGHPYEKGAKVEGGIAMFPPKPGELLDKVLGATVSIRSLTAVKGKRLDIMGNEIPYPIAAEALRSLKRKETVKKHGPGKVTVERDLTTGETTATRTRDTLSQVGGFSKDDKLSLIHI